MSGQTKYKPETVQPVSWPLADLDGFDFEDEILAVLACDYDDTRDAIRLLKTRRTGDGGTDAVVRSTIDFQFFDLPIRLGGRHEVTLFIQIKSSKHMRLTLKDFSASLVQTKGEKSDYYVLLTNSTVTPSVLYEVQEACRAKGMIFLLVDQFLLGPALSRRRGHRIRVPEIQQLRTPIVEYQFSKSESDTRQHVTIDMFLRNFSAAEQEAEIFLQSDIGWKLPEPRLQRRLAPADALSIRLEATRDDPGAGRELDVVVAFEDRRQEIIVPWRHAEETFTPLLAGERNMRLIADLTKFIDQRRGLAVAVITGEAGVGKSRAIEEVRKLREAPGVIFLRGHFDAAKPDAAFTDINRTLHAWDGRDRRLRVGVEAIDQSIAGLLSFIDKVDCRPQLVIIMEDLHYADAEVLDALATRISRPCRQGSGAVTLILTGRNDHTFINRHFFTFLDKAQMASDLDAIRFAEVERLTDDEAAQVVRSTIADCPDSACARIVQLSMNVPFNIVQVIQYLLDTKLAAVKNRNTVGIVNVYRFSLMSELPDSIETLILKRLESLKVYPFFDAVREFLLVASQFGYHIPRQVYDVMLDGWDLDEIDDLLSARRFLNRPGRDFITWDHENILHVFGKLSENEDIAPIVGRRLRQNPQLFGHLPELERGKVAAMAGDDVLAQQYWSQMISDVIAIENLSTNSLRKEYYKFLPKLVHLFRRTDRPIVDSVKACLAYAYLGVHHLPLQKGAESCAEARAMLIGRTDRRSGKEDGHFKDLGGAVVYGVTCLKQLEARAAVNMGQLRRADRLMAEVRCDLTRSSEMRADANILAEHYTTLSDLYNLYNHRWLAEQYLEFLFEVAETAESGQLLSLAKIHRAELDLLVDRERCVELNREALDFTRARGTGRHLTLNGLAIGLAELPMIANDEVLLLAAADKALSHLECCVMKQYSSSVPRAHRLLAAIQFQLGRFNRTAFRAALRHNTLALDSAIRYGAGLDLWRIHNDRAIILARCGEPSERVREQFETAVEHLRLCNLTFVGNRDPQSANLIVVANYIKFLAKTSERRVHTFIDELTWYDRPGSLSTSEKSKLIAGVIKNHVIFQTSELRWLLRDPETNFVLVG
jgi:AAA ATPase domain